jgi:hypothetical protein
MGRKLFTTVALLCCFTAVFAFFADVNGKWSGVLSTPDGNQFPLNYTFKTDNDKLTGTAQNPQGTVDITDGKIKGDSLSFNVEANGAKIGHSGKYFSDGDSVSLNIDFNGMKFHTTLKRAGDK